MSVKEVLRRIASQKGVDAETKVEKVMQTNFENNTLPDWILKYEKACKEDDSKGIDGWVYTTDVGKIKIQIKSSESGKEKFMRRHHWQDTAILVIDSRDSFDTILSKIISGIEPLRQRYLSKRSNLW